MASSEEVVSKNMEEKTKGIYLSKGIMLYGTARIWNITRIFCFVTWVLYHIYAALSFIIIISIRKVRLMFNVKINGDW